MKIQNQNRTFILRSVGLIALIFVITAFAKYDLNGLTVTDYKLNFIGNMLNLLIALIIIIGLVIFGFLQKSINKKRLNLITILLFISIICLVIAYILARINIFEKNSFIFNIPVKKAYPGFLFILSQFCQIYVLVYIWGIIFGFEKYFELNSLIRSILVALIFFLFALFYVWNVKSYKEENIVNEKFKYGLIPGAAVYSKGKPSPIFEARLRKALELFRKGIIEKIILTGSNAPGEITEAEAAIKYLTNLGIKSQNLIFENETSTTSEQIRFIKFGLTDKIMNEKILIISDGFHLTRVLEICNFFNVRAEGVSSDYQLSFEKAIFYRTRESIALLFFWFFAI